MRKAIHGILVVVLLLQLCSCGNSKTDRTRELELFRQTYQDVSSAYEVVEKYGLDIYEAWRIGIQEKDKLTLDYLSDQLSLSLDELVEGSVYAVSIISTDIDYDTMSDENKEYLRDSSDFYFSVMSNLGKEISSMAVLTIVGAYITSGKSEEIEQALNAAKENMRMLSQEFSDSEYYNDMKDYYTTTQSFYDFCKDPSGSFDQLRTTLNDYRNSIREYKNRLDFVFEDE